MSDREHLNQLLDVVPDYKIGYVVAYLQGMTEGEELKPNKETLEAMQELENGGGECFEGSTEEFFNKILNEWFTKFSIDIFPLIVYTISKKSYGFC